MKKKKKINDDADDGFMMIKKGTWTSEEDEILLNHVRKQGPTGWSSLRSKGLLPRTGKSCRLRYVNKLRPNLKTGCKFSEEEERTVIELQAQFGNKWAKIAKHLPGRTDNDVKNFWSGRRKRLERALRSPSSQSQKIMVEREHHCTHEHVMPMKVPVHGFFPPSEGNAETIHTMPLPDLASADLLNSESYNLPMLQATPVAMVPPSECDNVLPSMPSLLPDYTELIERSEDYCFLDILEHHHQETAATANASTNRCKIAHREENSPLMPDSCLDSFPADIFDYLEPLPSSILK